MVCIYTAIQQMDLWFLLSTGRAYWTLKTADQWLSLRLDFIGASLILLTAMLAIANRNHISPAIAALSLSQVCHMAPTGGSLKKEV